MKQPERWSGHRDRPCDCRLAMEPSFQALIDKAEDAGWEGEEIALALLTLAAAHFQQSAAKTAKRWSQ